MIDDAIVPNLQSIQRMLTSEFEIIKQGMRMIRSTIHDMGETRVTEGEMTVLHEDVDRVLSRLTALESRVEELEGHHSHRGLAELQEG
jgi:uncharacterized protein YicC (UPF0701 family)